jgi:hypothetical protein
MSTNIIKINRGDSFEFTITIPDKGNLTKSYILKSSEAIYFALLYPHQRFEDAILVKGYDQKDQNTDTGEITIKISSSVTKKLEPGVYYYTIKLQRGGTLDIIDDSDEPDEVLTIIERTKFIINE